MITLGELGLGRFRPTVPVHDAPSVARRRLPCAGKQPFKSRGAAEAAIRSLHRRLTAEGRTPDPVRAYECRCGSWHFGHQRT